MGWLARISLRVRGENYLCVCLLVATTRVTAPRLGRPTTSRGSVGEVPCRDAHRHMHHAPGTVECGALGSLEYHARWSPLASVLLGLLGVLQRGSGWGPCPRPRLACSYFPVPHIINQCEYCCSTWSSNIRSVSIFFAGLAQNAVEDLSGIVWSGYYPKNVPEIT